MDTEPTGPRRIPELWFKDGTLVIQAENTQFCVYRGLLAAQSSVFNEMLEFPQPPDSELVQGCPLVRMYDSPSEVMLFLKAIFYSDFFESYPNEVDPDTVTGILRLSHKYGVDYLVRRALRHLSSPFTTKLSDLDEERDISCWVTNDPATLIHIIQVAREVQALWLLPFAFYRLAGACSSSTDPTAALRPQVYNEHPVSLDLADQKSFMEGYIAQMGGAMSDVLSFLQTPVDIPGCAHNAECARARLHWLDMVRVERAKSYHQAAPLSIWGDLESQYDPWGKFCNTCTGTLSRTHLRARRTFWDQLPQMYDLPEWAELDKMKTAALYTTEQLQSHSYHRSSIYLFP
ncbi:hypothetical protein C8R43DRAFT_1079994 [Mycena crocata]|nr:hypothetical protein C8R43DRAFT_1079994 [Mycena crocata]